MRLDSLTSPTALNNSSRWLGSYVKILLSLPLGTFVTRVNFSFSLDDSICIQSKAIRASAAWLPVKWATSLKRITSTSIFTPISLAFLLIAPALIFSLERESKYPAYLPINWLDWEDLGTAKILITVSGGPRTDMPDSISFSGAASPCPRPRSSPVPSCAISNTSLIHRSKLAWPRLSFTALLPKPTISPLLKTGRYESTSLAARRRFSAILFLRSLPV